MAETFDILVVGAGPGGHAATVQAARFGARAAIIEKQGWGGTCTHRGCIPTKALLACSQRYSELKKLGRMGVRVTDPAIDFAAMKRHQEQIVKISAMGARKSLSDSGCTLKEGEGRILGPGEVEWIAPDGSRSSLSARALVIAWGSEPALIPGVNLSERILTSDGLLSLPTLPASLLIVGGSVIGVEFATLYAELGVRVTLIEMLDRLLPGEEPEASALLTQELKKLGVAVHTGVRMESIRQEGAAVRLLAVPAAAPGGLHGFSPPLAGGDPGEGAGVRLLAVPAAAPGGSAPPLSPSPRPPAHGDAGDSPLAPPATSGRAASGEAGDPREVPDALDLSAEYALICTGRKPRLSEPELKALGIRYDRKGIVVDEGLMTNVPGIFAVGDVTGGMMLAHRAMQQGRILADRLRGRGGAALCEEAIPAVAYTHPQIARVGWTEAEVKRRGIVPEILRADFGANITARTQLLGPGFVKLLFAGERLAGATIAGDQAGELIAPLSLAISAGLGRREIESWVIPHPTLSEVLK